LRLNYFKNSGFFLILPGLNFLKNIPGNNLPDDLLVARYKTTGHLDVLGQLFQRYMDLLYGVCFKYLKDADLAKDAVMQVFEELVVKLKQHEVLNFRSWVFTVAKNHCLMQLRTPRNLKTVEFNPEIVYWEEEMHQPGRDMKEQSLLKLEKCLEMLTPEQQEAVRLFYLEDKCYKEISEITGTEWSAIRSFIQNGRRNLRNCMDKTDES